MRGSTGFVKPLFFILLAVIVVIALGFVGADLMGGDKDLGTAVDFTAKTATGEDYTLSSYYGKGGTALIFFDRATSDGKTLLTNLSAAKAGTDVRTVLVAKGETDGKAITAYLAEQGLSVDVIIPDGKGEVCAKYNVSACPITYFINESGSVRAVSLSSLTASAAQKYIGYIAGA